MSPILENKYWYRVTKIMREHVDDLVNKAINFSDIKNGFAEYICEECGDAISLYFLWKGYL